MNLLLCGHELSCTMAGIFNFAALIPDIFDNLSQLNSFDQFINVVLNVMDKRLITLMQMCGKWEQLWNLINPSPFLSGTFEECILNNKDISQYGVKYNNSGIVCYGIGTLIDSLAAVNELIFVRKLVTYQQLKNILIANWEGYKDLLQIAKKQCPKWGIGNKFVDKLGAKICKAAADRINFTKNVKGGCYQMGCWSIDMYCTAGSNTRPTPDGRRKGDVINKNCSSTIGCDKEGIAGLFESVTSLDHSDFADGSVLDVMIPYKTVAGKDGTNFIVGLIRNYFLRGGLFIQFNILSSQQLKDAQLHPENYQNLQIRLCGWNVRFIDLPKIHQDCLIKEAENLS